MHEDEASIMFVRTCISISLVEVAGVEPFDTEAQAIDIQSICVDCDARCAQIDSQGIGSEYRDLARIVAAWDKLLDAHKRAIIAIVDSF